MKSFAEALGWLYGTQLFGVTLGLDSIRRLVAELGLWVSSPGGPGEFGPKFIHVAGTNGKGSTCAMLASLCREAGLRTGLYTSPHLVSFRERIRLDGEMIPEAAVLDGLSRIQSLIADWVVHPTFFEIVTALALDWFERSGAEVVVLETGLGGRLDATNIVTPVVSVLASIGLDHQQVLGGTLREIAGEKAGILKLGVPVVSACQEPEVSEVIGVEAARLGCELRTVDGPWMDGPVGLEGMVQRWNAALALLALDAAGLVFSPEVQVAGLANIHWPGRFQRIGESLILDGAHNAPAARALVSTWRELFPGEMASLVFGALVDKDVGAVLRTLGPLVGDMILVPVRSPRALGPAQVAVLVAEELPGIPCRLVSSLAEALEGESPRRRLVTGSLYLVGETLGLLQGTLPEWSAQ